MDLIDNAKKALDAYYLTLNEVNQMPADKALAEIVKVAENMADALTDLVYNE